MKTLSDTQTLFNVVKESELQSENLSKVFVGQSGASFAEVLEERGIDELREEIKDPKSFKYFLDLGYINNKGEPIDLVYHLDQFGYRKVNGKVKKPSIVCLGCSDTFGIGNFLHHTWPYLVANKTKKSVWNFGVPGGGLDQCYITLKGLMSKVKIETVMLLVPQNARKLFFYSDPKKGYSTQTVKFFPSILNPANGDKIDDNQKLLKPFYKSTCLSDESLFVNFHKNLDAIENICRVNNINLILLPNPIAYRNTFKDFMKACGTEKIIKNFGVVPSEAIKLPTARDFTHLGKYYQQTIATYFLERYNKEYSKII